MGTWESTGTLESSEFDYRGQKHLSLWLFLISLESYQSVDVENGLAWAIWTSAAQVMTKKKDGNQTSNLIPDH
jgi:hypothetical protein